VIIHPFIKSVLRFVACTIIVFTISYFTLPLALTEGTSMASKAISSTSTAIFMILNLPLWIMGKGAEIFKLDPKLVRLELLLNASFYGLMLAAWFSNTNMKKKQTSIRRGVE
jgi:hypothetical protein